MHYKIAEKTRGDEGDLAVWDFNLERLFVSQCGMAVLAKQT